MSETLYKAVFRYSGSGVLAGNHPACGLHSRIKRWLASNHRSDHYINAYMNTTDDSDDAELVVVLNDRTTALMLKLAVS